MIGLRETYVLDRNSEHLGVPPKQLMENAGNALAKTIAENYRLKGKNVVFLCGTGNNGGDGYVAARYLKEQCNVIVVLARPKKEIRSELALENLEKIASDGVRIEDVPADLEKILKGAFVVVDALLGVGMRKELKEPYRSIINKLNAMNKNVVSVDVPSGLGSDVSIRPRMTVTFHETKKGMDARNSGKIVVADIGIPEEAKLYTGPGEFVFYPVPEDDSRKGDNGRLLVIGGGPYTGAPALAAMASYAVGVDLVRLAVPSSSYQVIASYSPNFLMHPLKGNFIDQSHLKHLKELMPSVDSVLIGPGAGDHPATIKAISELIRFCRKPLVIDADAIKSVARNTRILKGKNGIITPHGGEFELLMGGKVGKDREARIADARGFAKSTGFVVIVKGEIDIISSPEKMKLNRTGNAGMAVGGTGDVLAGICAGLLAKNVEPFEAARLSAFINGSAGDLAFERKSYGLLATDVIDDIPNVFKKFLR
jgi:NAD(P)H-hydrate epimerase